MEDRKSRSWNAARRNCQTALESFLKCVQKRTLLLVEDVEIDGALVAYSNDWFSVTIVHSVLLR